MYIDTTYAILRIYAYLVDLPSYVLTNSSAQRFSRNWKCSFTNAALQMQLYKCVDMNKDNPKIEDDDYF